MNIEIHTYGYRKKRRQSTFFSCTSNLIHYVNNVTRNISISLSLLKVFYMLIVIFSKYID